MDELKKGTLRSPPSHGKDNLDTSEESKKCEITFGNQRAVPGDGPTRGLLTRSRRVRAVS